MEWPSNGSAPDLTLLLGEVAGISRHTLIVVESIHRDIDDLKHENTQRRIEHAILKTKHDSLEAKIEAKITEPPGLSLTMLSGLMERGGEALEWGKAIFKALLTVRDLVIWLLSGTAIYHMFTQPLATKHILQSCLGWIGLSF